MNPGKKVYDGWILCPSTRFVNKFYYFNPATREAVWNLNDMERRMVSRPNFTNSEKWHTYPEPDGPPDSTNSWGYQPDFRPYHHTTPAFGQVTFPKYHPNTMENFSHNMWGFPQPMYMNPRPSMANMPQYEPMPQMWGNYAPSQKHFMQDNNYYSFPCMQTLPSFNNDPNRQVFGLKPTQAFQIDNNREMMKKRRMSMDNINLKEPLFKKLRSQTDLQDENIFGAKDNIFQARPFESSIPYKMSDFQAKESMRKTCNCMLSKSHENLSMPISKAHENLSMPFSKSHENLGNIGSDSYDFKRKEKPFANAGLSRSKSMGNLTVIAPSEISSNFSFQNSFIFPLRKSETTKSFENVAATALSPKRKVQNSTVTQSGQDVKRVQGDTPDSQLSTTDLRYILLAKRRKSSLSEPKVSDKGNKIKTSYTNDDKLRESVSRKRVTFALGVEGSILDGDDVIDHDVDLPNDTEGVEADPEPEAVEDEVRPCFLVPDADALLAEFDLIEKVAKTEPYILLIVDCVRRAVAAACGARGGGRSVLAARHVARRLAEKQPHIRVQSSEAELSSMDSAAQLIDCCRRVYEEGCDVVLITNNEELYNKGLSMEIDCYTTDEVREWSSKPEVSFDRQTDEPPADAVPPKTVAKQPFSNTIPKEDQFFLSKENDENLPFLDNNNTQKSFLDKHLDIIEETTKINREIEKLSLGENLNVGNCQKVKKHAEKDQLFKNNADAKEESYAARKELKNINVYNLEGLMKSFSIKNRDMEESIAARIDEYFCCFSQIMEASLLDTLLELGPVDLLQAEPGLTPLQAVLQLTRTVHSDHRTARALIDKLTGLLDTAYTKNGEGRHKLILKPQGFVKIFGCGTLLLKVLEGILPFLKPLPLGSCALERLGGEVERGAADQQHWHYFVRSPPQEPRCAAQPGPRGGGAPRPAGGAEVQSTEKVAQPATKVAQSTTKVAQPTPKVARPTSTVVRTTGRHLGSLKLDPQKPLVLNNEENNNEIEGNDYIGDKYENLNSKLDVKEIKSIQAKAIRKLAIESLNLPPKMREIDVQKRGRDDNELTMLLNQIVTCSVPPQPLTKHYNLKSIIVNENDKTAPASKTDEKRNPNMLEAEDLKTNNKIDSTTQITETINNYSKKNEVQNLREPLNLDALNYSDIEESVLEQESMLEDSPISKNQIVESDNSNLVTTTQHSNRESPNVDNDNEKMNRSNESIDESNENAGNKKNNDKIANTNEIENKELNDVDNENDDSGIESFQAYSFIQNFLMSLSTTFLMVKQFIETSASNLSKKRDEASKGLVYDKAESTRVIVERVITNLNLIMERESNTATSVLPVVLRDPDAEADHRITKYRRVVGRCWRQARVLRTALLGLQRLAREGQYPDDLTEVSNTYSNLFE